MESFNPYNLIIGASVVIIISFGYNELARKTNIPSVLMLILTGILLKFGFDAMGIDSINFFPILKVLGIVGLIMIVLEAALELELKQEKYALIFKALGIALVSLVISSWIAALILYQFIPGMNMQSAWLYGTLLSILSSAIIIPSVTGLQQKKKEFHVYEGTFSDILGIMAFFFISGQLEATEHSSGVLGFSGNVLLTIVISVLVSYLIVLIFQKIKSHTKLFLLIAVLTMLYAIGKQMHLSSLIIILVFGLLIANMHLFFRGRLRSWLDKEKAKEIYEGLHIITIETSFVVRTFFFLVFGITIKLATLASVNVVIVSLLIILSIYLIRYVLLRVTIGKDIIPQLFIAPRGLITILLFYSIPEETQVAGFDQGILLFIIIGTSLIMTFAMIYDKQRISQSVRKAEEEPVGYEKWKAPAISELVNEED